MANYITPSELRSIADTCDSFDKVWDLLTGNPVGGVSFEMQGSLELDCYDANGEILGRIDWGDEKAVFYAAASEEQ